MPTSLQTAILSGLRNPYPGATLALDFVGAATNGAQYYSNAGVTTNLVSSLPGWTFSRTGVEYASTSSGLLVPFGSGVPAVTDLGLQVWEARTNSILRSQDFGNASWGKVQATVASATTVAPDGTTTADTITDTDTSTAALFQDVTTAAGAQFTASEFLQRGNHDWVLLTLVNGTVGGRAWFNLATGAVGTVQNISTGTGTTASIVKYGNFYRCTLTTTPGGAGTTMRVQTNSASADASFTRILNGTRIQWGAQGGPYAFEGPYIPTTSASATRGAASASVGGLSTALTAPFTMFVDATLVDADGIARYLAEANDGTSNNRVAIVRETDNSIRVYVINGGSAVSNSIGGKTGARRIKAAVAVSGSQSLFAVDGVAGTAITATAPTMSTLQIGQTQALNRALDGTVARSVVYPGVAMSQAQINALTQ